MSGDLLSFGNRPDRASRGLARSLAALNSNTALELARISAIARTQAERVAALEFVTETALLAVGRISRLEETVALTIPSASGRLNLVAETATLGIAHLVSDSIRMMRS